MYLLIKPTIEKELNITDNKTEENQIINSSINFKDCPKYSPPIINDAQIIDNALAFKEMNIDKTNFNENILYDYNYTINKPNDTIRIVALGDSFTKGYGVPFKYSWPKQLEKILNEKKNKKFEVINLGEGGAGTYKELEIFKNVGLNYSPDIIILQMLNNDWECPCLGRLMNIKWEEYLKGNYTLPLGIQQAVSQYNMSSDEISRIISLITVQEYYQTLEKQNLLDKEIYTYMISSLANLIKICKEKNITLFVVGIDSHPSLDCMILKLLKYEYGNTTMFIDLSNEFPVFDEKLRLPDYHPSIEGHSFIASKIFDNFFSEKG
jgi:hypothetical protein